MGLRLHAFGAVVVVVAVGMGCGETPVSLVVDSGHSNTLIEIDAGPPGVVDAGRDAGTFTWADAGQPDSTWVWSTNDGGTGSDGGCELTMCFTGAPSRGGTNAPFDAICDDPAVPGVIRSTSTLGSHTTFNTLLVDAKKTLYPKLFQALDTNGDNQVNNLDHSCSLNLLGYSWGGISAAHVAEALNADNRVEPSRRRVNRLFAIDPYRPATRLTVPTNVLRFVEYRHSVTPSGDCSENVPGGPYAGLQPHCYPSQNCVDYDYSLSPTASFPAHGGGSFLGSDVGHCEVPMVAAAAILAEFKGLPFTAMPAQRPIASP